MSLAEFATDYAHQEATISIVNRNSERPVYRLLASLFDTDAVRVVEEETDGRSVPPDTVLLHKTDPDGGIAVSSLGELREELLLVNSDVYVTGSRELDDVDTPDVIAELEELPFTVSGYPENPKEKLLLIEISRQIEAMAWQAGEGRLATGFQYLSRLDDELGTRRVYRRLGRETAVDAHVYGLPDAEPSLSGVTTHRENTRELERSWFVVYQSDAHPQEAAALVAVQRDSHTWEGTWAYDPSKADAVLEYLDRAYD